MPKQPSSEQVLLSEPAPSEPVVPVVFVKRPKDKMYSLEQWAKANNKPDRHLDGMRAFLGNEAGNKYSMETWDLKMKSY